MYFLSACRKVRVSVFDISGCESTLPVLFDYPLEDIPHKFKRSAYDDDLAEVCQPPFKKQKLNPKGQLVSLLIKRKITVEDIQRLVNRHLNV